MAQPAGQISYVRFSSSHQTGLHAEKLSESSGHRVRVPIPFRFPKVRHHCLSVKLKRIAANIEELHSIRIGSRD